MGIESLIPFGLATASEELVDVGSVERGNACGCICPSCKTPLVARHGNKKEWHFAHRSQKVHNETRKECEFSFAVSVRLMIRQLSRDGLKFKTPSLKSPLLVFSEHTHKSADFSYLVAKERTLILEEVKVGAQFCGVTVDVLGLVKNFPFVVFVTYKERSLPSELKKPSMIKCGVVELNVNAVRSLFKQEEKGQYKEALRRYIEEITDGKTWAYHPSEQKQREDGIRKSQAWLRQQETEALASNRWGLRKSSDLIEPNPFIEDDPPVQQSVGKYICLLCNSVWEGTSRTCNKCKTHLYTSERE